MQHLRLKTLRETTKLVRVHHLRWVVQIFILTFLTLCLTATRRPTVFDCLKHFD